MKKLVVITIILVFLFLNTIFCDDSKLSNNLSAVLIGEYDSGEILYQYNINESIEIASITKLMTYLVVMDMVSEGKVNINDNVIIGKNPTKIGGSTFSLAEGENIKLQTLLEAILIASGNDACVAISEHVTENEEKFVLMMNQKAKEIGLKSTVFVNSSGMPKKTVNGEKVQNMMSVKDIFILSRYIINKYPEILKITDRINLDIPERGFFKENTNPLLKEIDKVDGLKTGYTDKAGFCLISTLELPQKEDTDEKFRVIVIAMGAETKETRKEKSKELIKYIFSNYKKEIILSKDKAVKEIYIKNAIESKVEIYPRNNLAKLVKRNDKVKTEIFINNNLMAPISQGDRVGKVYVYVNNAKVDEIDLIVTREIKKDNIFIKFFDSLQKLLIKNYLEDIIFIR